MTSDFVVVYVHWRDAMHSMSQHAIASLGVLAELHEIGFLLGETETSITIGTERETEHDTEARMWLTIPKANIIEQRRSTLRKAFPKKKASKVDSGLSGNEDKTGSNL